MSGPLSEPPAPVPPAPVPPAAAAPEAAAGPEAVVTPRPGGPSFRLRFQDDFDGNRPDPGRWFLYDGPGNAGFGLRRPSALAVADGRLVITAGMVDGALVSGGMATKRSQTYGRWEARVRTDPDPSGATSGVVLTWPVSNNWPVDGENNIYETLRTPDRRPFHSFVHWGVENHQEELIHDADGTAWQVMAMDWTPEGIWLYRDGMPAGEVTRSEAIPHVPHKLAVQLDAWADTMGAPVTMEVDWVRIYELVSERPC